MTSKAPWYAEKNRVRCLIAAAALVVVIAVADWFIVPDVGLSFLCFFPLILASAFLSRWQIVSLAFICAALRDLFMPANLEKWPRLVFVSAAYIFVGLFVRGTVTYRRTAQRHVLNFERELQQRQRVQEEQEKLLNSGPAAILTVSSKGKIVFASLAAHNIFKVAPGALTGQHVDEYLPGLQQIWSGNSLPVGATAIDCPGQKGNREVFSAKVWVSSLDNSSGPVLSVMVLEDAKIGSLQQDSPFPSANVINK